ncbi:hypothetical protein BRC72_10955 [Halobacteriales archaeon QH_7_66_36]|nr:MAG: hypothetical protein BRC72_10955 [Halobacteriales archaeon QH_7_66_36]
MECERCGGPMTRYQVPFDLRSHVETDHAATCTRCLAGHPAEAGGEPDFSTISDEFPDGTAGAAMALALGKLDSLALNRDDIEALFAAVEAAGVDPLLVLDRLATQGNVRLHFDADRRRRQLEQLL